MKMTKIEILKKTVYRLVNTNSEYNWTSKTTCNAGHLMMSIFSVDSHKLESMVYEIEENFGSMWSGDYRNGHSILDCHSGVCPVSGFPVSEMFKTISDAGFSIAEIRGLEWLNDKIICEKLGWEYFDDNNADDHRTNRRSEKRNLIAYITAWIEILEEEQDVSPHALMIEEAQEVLKEKTVYVVLDKEVRELAKTAQQGSVLINN